METNVGIMYNGVIITGQTVSKESAAAIWTLSANDMLDDDIVSVDHVIHGSHAIPLV